MSANIDSVLNALYEDLTAYTAHHAGYPYNLAFNPGPVSRFLKFSLNNIGDPYVGSNYAIGTRAIEREVIAFFGKLYGLEQPWGYVTACGTEGNYYGIWPGTRLFPTAPILTSVDSHYSLGKAAAIAKTRLIYIESKVNGEMDYSDLERNVKGGHGPFVVNANIGTTITGAVDGIDRICNILAASGRSFHLHCDGALGGLLEPFLSDETKLNFARYPIGSISVSGHKFIGAPMPCGVVLARKEHVSRMEQRVEYISSSDTTIMGSRNGLTPLFIWQAIHQRDFAKEAKECRRNAEFLCGALDVKGWRPLLNDMSTTVVFNKPSDECCRRWQLATAGDRAHVVVMQNHTRAWLKRFLEALDDVPLSRSAAV